MSRELILMRHAKSAWDSGVPSDFERPLAGRGKRDAPRMGRWLHGSGLVPDHVVSSPARRARKTTLKVCAELGLDARRVVWAERVYDAGLGDLQAVLEAVPAGARRVLLVGHNPGLDGLLEFLSAGRPPRTADGKLLTTAAVARLELPEAWNDLPPGSGRLLALVRPKDLG